MCLLEVPVLTLPVTGNVYLGRSLTSLTQFSDLYRECDYNYIIVGFSED